MEKLDLTRAYRKFFTAGNHPEVVELERASYLSLTGKGDPSGEQFARDIEALYSVAYAVKFRCKGEGNDFVVAQLEGLWWYDEERYPGFTIDSASVSVPRSEWEYRLLIRLPDFATEEHVKQAVHSVREKKKMETAEKVGYFELEEGKCVQILHTGPFDKEADTLKVMGEFIRQNNFQKNGHHHEIYLSDFRKTPPEKLKTILREPVK